MRCAHYNIDPFMLFSASSNHARVSVFSELYSHIAMLLFVTYCHCEYLGRWDKCKKNSKAENCFAWWRILGICRALIYVTTHFFISATNKTSGRNAARLHSMVHGRLVLNQVIPCTYIQKRDKEGVLRFFVEVWNVERQNVEIKNVSTIM
jgi:hypothetical protein